MKLSTQVVLCFSLLPLVTQALPVAGSANASSKDAAASNAGRKSADDQNAASAKTNNANDNNNDNANNANNANNNNNTNANNTNNQNAQQDAPPPVNENHKPSDQQILNAVMSWMNDTGKVTNFLNTATSFSGDAFTDQATIALNAEIDELNHKKVLDDALLAQDPNVQAANEVLDTQGTFQKVVDVLQSMVDNGPDNAQAQVNEINQNRCVNVLPNIDQYFAAAGNADVSAVRPTGCLEITAAAATEGAQAEATSESAAVTDSASAAEVTGSSSSNGVGASSTKKVAGSTSKDAGATEETGVANNENSGQRASGNEEDNEEDVADDD